MAVNTIGYLGETLLKNWLETQAWQILAQNWHCRWGELDVVAQAPDGSVVFIEVKTRQQHNQDADGLWAITPSKQRKLIQAAALFLAQHPHWADYPCRFDVALVQYGHPQWQPQQMLPKADLGIVEIAPGQAGRFFLVDYLPDAFTA